MDDKVFNLLEKMYSEIQEGFKKVDTRLTKIETTLETNVKPDIKLSLQGFIDTNEKLTSIETKVDNLGAKIETHDVEINVIKRVK
jgi:tetrahydromethanopterin S-methyltransferase subunit G